MRKIQIVLISALVLILALSFVACNDKAPAIDATLDENFVVDTTAREVNFGEAITIEPVSAKDSAGTWHDATIEITDPNGNTTVVEAGSYTPQYLGAYKLTYKIGNLSREVVITVKDLSEPIDASRLTGGGAPIAPMDPSAGAPAGGTPAKQPHEGAGYSPSSSSYYTENTGGDTDYIPTEELAYGGNIDDSEYTPEKEPIGDGPSFISPYSNNMGKLKKSAIERIAKALDGDALRVKIIN